MFILLIGIPFILDTVWFLSCLCTGRSVQWIYETGHVVLNVFYFLAWLLGYKNRSVNKTDSESKVIKRDFIIMAKSMVISVFTIAMLVASDIRKIIPEEYMFFFYGVFLNIAYCLWGYCDGIKIKKQ